MLAKYYFKLNFHISACTIICYYHILFLLYLQQYILLVLFLGAELFSQYPRVIYRYRPFDFYEPLYILNSTTANKDNRRRHDIVYCGIQG